MIETTSKDTTNPRLMASFSHIPPITHPSGILKITSPPNVYHPPKMSIGSILLPHQFFFRTAAPDIYLYPSLHLQINLKITGTSISINRILSVEGSSGPLGLFRWVIDRRGRTRVGGDTCISFLAVNGGGYQTKNPLPYKYLIVRNEMMR